MGRNKQEESRPPARQPHMGPSPFGCLTIYFGICNNQKERPIERFKMWLLRIDLKEIR